MNLTWLRSFVAVAEALSFSKASAQLRISQPTLSYQIRLLEQELGLELLDRSTHHVRLTPAGRAVLDTNRRIFSEIDALQNLARVIRQGLVGEMLIGTVTSVGTYLLPRYLQAFRDQFPGIRISIVSKPQDEVVRLLSERAVDVAFVTAYESDRFSQFESIVVCESELVFICGPRCRNRCPNYDRSRLEFAELVQDRVIYYDGGAPEQDAIRRLFGTHGIRIQPILESDQIETIKKMATAGLGCAILPAFAVQTEIENGQLTHKPWSDRVQLRVLALFHSNPSRLRAHDTFLNLLAAGTA